MPRSPKHNYDQGSFSYFRFSFSFPTRASLVPTADSEAPVGGVVDVAVVSGSRGGDVRGGGAVHRGLAGKHGACARHPRLCVSSRGGPGRGARHIHTSHIHAPTSIVALPHIHTFTPHPHANKHRSASTQLLKIAARTNPWVVGGGRADLVTPPFQKSFVKLFTPFYKAFCRFFFFCCPILFWSEDFTTKILCTRLSY